MRKCFAGIMAAVALAGVFFAGQASADIKIKTIKYAMTVPMDDVGGVGLKVFIEQIDKLSGGKIKVQTFTGAQLGSVKAHFDAAQSGGMDIVYAAASAVSGIVPEINITDLPFFLPGNYKDNWKVLDASVSKAIGKYLNERMGLHFLGFSSYGFKQFHTTNKVIHNVNDMSGMKMRILPSKLLAAEMKAWGAVPTPIDFSEVYTALQQGVADGGENTAHGTERVKWYEVQKGFTVTYHCNFLGLQVANEKWWKSLTDEEKEIVSKAAAANIKAQRDYLVADEEACIERLRKKGLKIYRLNDSERKEFIDKSRSVWDLYKAQGETSKQLFDAAQKDIKSLAGK